MRSHFTWLKDLVMKLLMDLRRDLTTSEEVCDL